MQIKTFKEIVAWKKAHELTLEVYKLSTAFPKHELFSLTNQTRRCGISIPSNIAEGFARRTKNDSVHFYNIAQGSLEELKYQLLLAKDLGYIPLQKYERVLERANEVGKLLHGWITVQR